MDAVFKFFLAFSHSIIIIPLLILGYIWLDRQLFFQTICLLFFSMLVNFALKVTFKVPLMRPLSSSDFAFPSGHMQSTCVLYGWLMMAMDRWFYKILIIGLLIGIGMSLVHFRYHNYFDIVGAVCIAALLIAAYRWLLNTQSQLLMLIVLLGLSTGLMVYIAVEYKIVAGVWMAYYGLMGILISEYYFASNVKRTLTQYDKIFATIICFIVLFILKAVFSVMTLPFFLSQMQWLIIGLLVPFSCHAFALIKGDNRP